MTDQTDGDTTDRRTALRLAATGLAGSLAGCLSNPWEPGGEPANKSAAPTSDGGAGDTDDPSASTGGNETDGGGDEAGDEPGETGGASDGSSDDSPSEPDLVVEVAPDGFRFEPSTFEIERGDTVRWVWRASGHNVRVRSKPDESTWDGTPGSASDTYAEGNEHSHTFEATGDYEFFCAPHQTLGMEGSFTVR
ncbi:Copper binding protein, plastocyanin/azurin family [Natronoarchaeum philippinense]|uniref:Copper binding protein, plastocyanin/azurin family n=1 Tax=Natronoarchaeum philippinense TaxID=558529 RepID=A0A285N331_NATPI|nr:plastocyanin/azurin family copper-binding protein [Natronoarchaeum philippinense]SNZ03353.1 Copper binding protein, plastocyanin/azurin family [Natronoarchaeum philippinense]